MNLGGKLDVNLGGKTRNLVTICLFYCTAQCVLFTQGGCPLNVWPPWCDRSRAAQRETYITVVGATRYFTEEYGHCKTKHAASESNQRQQYFQYNRHDRSLSQNNNIKHHGVF